MSSSFLDNFNKNSTDYILKYTFSDLTIMPLIDWRDRAIPGTVDAWGRRFAVVIPMALLGIANLVDSAISLFFSVFTFPAEFFGINLARNFFTRGGNGVLMSSMCLTYLQYSNIFERSRSLRDSLNILV